MERPAPVAFHRLQSIDFVRGLIMILMALDHVREFFTYATFSPTDLSATTWPYFLTRWITHFCAPAFSLLTGVGAYLWYTRGRTKQELSRFLLTRGVWLIFLELVITRCFGWAFNFNYQITVAGVLWILGLSMIVLGGAVWLPMRAITGIALATIALHNLMIHIPASAFGRLVWIWDVLYRPANLEITPGHNFFTAYVLIPWFAVMMGGFSLGQIFRWEPTRRRTFLLRVGAAATGCFVAIRALNVYGDPVPWTSQKNLLFTVLSFLNCTKYPPSLEFLLMTLGPVLILLGLLDGVEFLRLRPVVIFGRVPLFYYVVHIPVMHVIAIAISYWRYGDVYWFFRSHSIAEFPSMRPPGWGFNLMIVYLIWVMLVTVMYPACRWYAGVKRKGTRPWLSYL